MWVLWKNFVGYVRIYLYMNLWEFFLGHVEIFLHGYRKILVVVYGHVKNLGRGKILVGHWFDFVLVGHWL